MRTTFGEVINQYIVAVTGKRPGEASRIAERARLSRFQRNEQSICAYALNNLTPAIFEEWRDRRLVEKVVRGPLEKRGPQKAKNPPAGRVRMDGTPRANAAKSTPQKPVGIVKAGTVRREMTLLKRVPRCSAWVAWAKRAA